MAQDTPITPEEETATPADETMTQEQTIPGSETPEQAAEPAEPSEQNKEPETPVPEKQEEQAASAKKGRRSRPPKADKGNKPEKDVKDETDPKAGKAAESPAQAEPTEQEAPEQEAAQEPVEAPRPEQQEQIIYLKLSDLHPFKDHPFSVRDDEEMQAMVASVKDKGVTTPAVVRPREDGGYEIVSGHRRQMASERAGYTDMPCIVRNLTDEQTITQMVEDNTNQRESILPSERAKALKMQLDAIKRQGSRDNGEGNGQRSNEIVAERNQMTVKQVQRYIKLNELVPELIKMVDEKKIAFTPAVEMAFISRKNQQYIAVAIEGQASAPSLSQAQRMRELDQQKTLNPDVIDGIMLEEKKEVDKVILNTQELSRYFGRDKTPREMKDTIMKLLEDWKDQQQEHSTPKRETAEQEK